MGQERLRSWSDHSGYDQSAVRRLRATKGREGAVDSIANGMATDRHSALAAYRGLGRFPGGISEAKCPDAMPARTTDGQPASEKPKHFRLDRRAHSLEGNADRFERKQLYRRTFTDALRGIACIAFR
jgi:hypothetical protein